MIYNKHEFPSWNTTVTSPSSRVKTNSMSLLYFSLMLQNLQIKSQVSSQSSSIWSLSLPWSHFLSHIQACLPSNWSSSSLPLSLSYFLTFSWDAFHDFIKKWYLCLHPILYGSCVSLLDFMLQRKDTLSDVLSISSPASTIRPAHEEHSAASYGFEASVILWSICHVAVFPT